MKNNKKIFIFRTVLIAFLILSFVYICSIFTYQYIEYQKTEARLNKAYGSKNQLTTLFYKLFSSYNAAGNAFRLYTVDFSSENLADYTKNLDTLRFYIDSLSSLSTKEGISLSTNNSLEQNIHLSDEFAKIKQSVDNMLFLAKDSLTLLTKTNRTIRPAAKKIHADSIINRILRDTALNVSTKDTIVRKKEKLFTRIFRAKDDTLVSDRFEQQFNINQINAIHNQVQTLIEQNESFYKQDFNKIRHSFAQLQQKERQLLQSNYALFSTISTALIKIKTTEDENLRAAEIQDFALYKENSSIFGKQVIASLILMIIMVALLLYYHYNTVIYERKITAARDYALKAAKEKTSILANVSHDVRTPVNSLVSIIDLLKDNASNNRVNPALLDTITQDIHVINETVEDILNLGKLESGMLEVKEEYFSPAQLLANLVKMQQGQADKKGLKLINHIDIAPDILIKSGAYRLRQIVSNLLSNAIKYTAKGEVMVKAYITKDTKPLLHVQVIDTGMGIPAKDQQHIFEQYYMTDLKSKNSFGLGLHISKLMTEQLQGKLTVKSQIGKGSTFSLTIPVTGEKKDSRNTLSLDKFSKDLHFVIIDDNPINNLFVKQALQYFNTVEVYQDAQSAMEYLKKNTVDIVITDLKMKDASGWDILHMVKDHMGANGPNCKVIALTADETLVKGTPEGQAYQFDGVMIKPFDPAALIPILSMIS
ncbi:response regulator [Sphingobacterium sp. N143]|uniref:ATP-binding response regulator n=1 Tax=Sphingobacterium sp. N143 TaxID=2746727 RepID=UPI002574DE31|nr:hybrid sensor histidine kinase/response regulator [Sphingobacterium sp. N143]MDM1295368.1 response regulator [Sphingobacterium sp. N143]